MKVNIISNFFGSSGFSSHTKQLANALHEKGIEVRIDCQRMDGWETTVNDAEYLMLTREFDSEMVSIVIGQPPFLPLAWADNPKHVIPFVIWEGDKVPEYWIKHLLDERIKQVWTCSLHTKNAIMNTAMGSGEQLELNEKIKIVPHGVDLSIFDGEQEEQASKPFIFLANKGWAQGINDRGGVQWLIQAYVEEFTKEEDVEMRVKINPAYVLQGWNPIQEVENLGIQKEESSPSLLISAENVDYKDMKLFYQGDVFVSSSMAEAFNLPVLEAMAMGVPTIVTNYGGQTDFVTEENGWLIDGEMINVTWDKQYEGVQWMKPNIEQLRKTMRACFNNREEVKEKAKKAREESIKWTWAKSAKKAIDCLKEL